MITETTKQLTSSATRRPCIRLAVRAYETHRWSLTRILYNYMWHFVQDKTRAMAFQRILVTQIPYHCHRDCACANGFTVFSECLDVVELRVSTTNDTM